MLTGSLSKKAAAISRVAAVSLMPLAGCAAPASADPPRASVPQNRPDDHTRLLDDSYTVSQRWEANSPAHPEFAMPTLDVGGGRRIMFDRLYAKRGSRELHADVFLPAPSDRPAQALVLVHGGAWRSGNKSNFYAMANLLAQRGYAVILPEYRLAVESPYPAGLIDVNAAIDWTIRNAAMLGIDPARIAIGGESSGGQMAALIAYTGGTPLFADGTAKAPRVNALIDLDGVLDFTTPLALRYENAAGEDSAAARWLGGSMETAPQTWEEASATTHLSATSPPTLIVSGEDDRFTAGRDEVIATLTANGTPVRHIHFDGLPHTFWLFDPYLGQGVDAIDAFLQDMPASRPQQSKE